MTNEQLRELLYEKYIVPTRQRRERFIGVEIEIPTVNLLGDATDHGLTQQVFAEFMTHFGFAAQGFDRYGVCYSATNPETGDNISFDCSYNNLELSFGREQYIRPLAERFEVYIRFLNRCLEKEHHMLTGMGINPNFHVNRENYLPVPRYQMLEGYLRRGNDWKYPMYLHPYAGFGTFASASQVQLDVMEEELIPTIWAHALLEPVKSVLFANAWMEDEPELLCVRDLFWENSTHGINPHNVGMYESLPSSTEELLDYIEGTSLFCAQRGDHYCHFKPIKASEYFHQKEICAEYFWEGVYHPYRIVPEIEDLQLLRTYKFEDLTYRGTIEYRSCCSQPFADAFSVAAFHLGLAGRTGELLELLQRDQSLYHHGYTASELRKLMNHRVWTEFVDRKGLQELCFAVLELAESGLKEEGLGDEIYLKSLFDRAERLASPARDYVEGLESGKSVNDLVYQYAQI